MSLWILFDVVLIARYHFCLLITDLSMDYGNKTENTSHVLESRSSSFTHLVQAPRQALSGIFNRVFPSQSTSEFQERDVRYPTLPPLYPAEGSIPGAFPESPQKGPSTIELPQASDIGSENPASKIVLDTRGMYTLSFLRQ